MTVFNNPGGPPPAESEDCLYINVFTPTTPAPAGGRTVMFWIYGGNLQFGTANIPPYDGSSFAANQDVVLVTHNYRTNGKEITPNTKWRTLLIIASGSVWIFQLSAASSRFSERRIPGPAHGSAMGPAKHQAIRG